MYGLEQICSAKFLAEFKTSLKHEEELKNKIRYLQSNIKKGSTKFSDIDTKV